MADRKIVIIGAGSAEFGSQSIVGIMKTPSLRGYALHLVDIDAEKLALITNLALKLNRELDAGMEIHSTTERKEALEAAGFVVLSIAVEREELWLKDYRIGLKHGVTHYAENGGPAAFFHSIRNMAQIVPILKDMKSLCPNAFLLNYTNPMQRICTAIQRLSSIRFIGVCHQLSFGYFILGVLFAEELGLEFPEKFRFEWTDAGIYRWFTTALKMVEKFEITAAGINHFTWMLSLKDRETGRDWYPLFLEKINNLPPTFEPLTQKLFNVFKLMPVAGDCHITEYLPYTSKQQEKSWERYDIQFYDLEWAKQRRNQKLKQIQDIVEDREPVESVFLPYSERAEILIDGIASNRHHYEEALNIPNRGYITNLPDGAIVEVPGILTADGPSGIVVGDLPEPIADMCRRQIVINELTVDAYKTRDKNLIYQLFALDPMISDLDAATALADDYYELYENYLPVFDEE